MTLILLSSMVASQILLAFAGSFTNTKPLNNAIGNPLINSACQTLETQYPTQLFWPGSAEYTNETTSFWSQTTVLTPYCVFSPATASDVSTAVKVLTSTSTQFAVRGAGHMPVKAAASTDQGVLIAMTRLRDMQWSSTENETIASIGPGLTWWDVTEFTSARHRVVLGGRFGPVGVPGLLLGGGVSYFSGQHGWAANHVVGYQIVIANATVLEVTSSSHPDLFWALKGGSSNYGIVTRFDLATFPEPPVYAGTLAIDTPQVPEFLNAFESWVEPGAGIDDPQAAIVHDLLIYPKQQSVQGAIVVFHAGEYSASGKTNQSAPPVLQNFTNIPTTSSTAQGRSYSAFLEETLVYQNRSFRNTFHATSFVADPAVVRIMNDTLVPAALSQLRGVADCYVSGNLQPISTQWMKAAQAAGGDALALDPADGNVLALNVFVQWSNPADDDLVTAFATNALTEMNKKASAVGLSYPFIYMNDATGGEQIYQFYGKGASLPKMRKIRQQYDPSGVFQYLVPGGFKIGV